MRENWLRPGLMPEPRKRTLSRFEFWPAWAFYAPVWLWIGGLALRHRGLRVALLANPDLPAGGLVGESKRKTFGQLTGEERHWLAPYTSVVRIGDVEVAEEALAKAHLEYPLVAKPDIGCRGAGVRAIRNAHDLARYWAEFPPGETMILQEMVDMEGEAGVFYVRPPGGGRAEILSLTLKYFPHVVGDGRSTIRELILADPRAGQVPQLYLPRFSGRLDEVLPIGRPLRLVFAGNHSKGAIFQDGAAHITEAMRARFDAIARSIPNFNFGRFDVRFADLEAFKRGEDFRIVEFNGAGAESTHIWDADMSLPGAWAALCKQFSLLFAIGAANRKLGHRPERWRDFLARWRREKALTLCYPATE